MAGVISTFLAFYIQVEANREQREQFFKTMKKGEIDKKIDTLYHLQLTNLDVANMIADVKSRCNEIEGFIAKVEEKPFELRKIIKVSLLYLSSINGN